jgi:hypothetical protein
MRFLREEVVEVQGHGKRANVNRESEDEHERIVKDYFGEDPVFPPEAF